jgi:hypothetical protein
MGVRSAHHADWLRARRARRVFTPHIGDVPDDDLLDWVDDVYPDPHDDRDDDGEYDNDVP